MSHRIATLQNPIPLQTFRHPEEYPGQLLSTVILDTLPTREGTSRQFHVVQELKQKSSAQLHMQPHRKTTHCN
jgi:hypothetical protein